MNNFPLLPDQASTYATQVDAIGLALTSLTAFFTAVVFILVTVFAIRYRRGSNVNRKTAGDHNTWVEIAWSLPLVGIALVMFVWNVKPYAEVFNPPPDAEEIFVIGKRWMWHLQHSVNGIRENNELHVPVGRPFKLTLISQDVIHGFYVPDFRIKRDAMPGQYNTVWFTATKPGKHHLFCSEYCGTDHSQMGGWVYVMTPGDYNNWVRSGGTSAAPPKTPEQAGYELFTQLACGNCHKNQDAIRAPTLYNLYGRQRNLQNGKVVTADDSYIRKAIRTPEEVLLQGYNATMPTYKDSLDEEQVHDLIMYIKSLGNGAATNGKTAATAPKQGNKPTSEGEQQVTPVVTGATQANSAPQVDTALSNPTVKPAKPTTLPGNATSTVGGSTTR